MANRLPTPGSDDGTWGDILNTFLSVSHDPTSGALLTAAVQTAGGVTSVNGKSPSNGVVTLVPSDIGSGDAATLQGTTVDGSAPSDGQALIYNATAGKWAPATVTTSGTVSDSTTGSKGIVQLAGDLGGTASAPTVLKIKGGIALPASAPTNGQVLTATGTSATAWSTPATAPVTSVAGKTGVVTLIASDVGADASGAAATVQSASLQKSSNLSDLASVSSARTNLGLGTAATISATAGGDLSGTLPSPTVAKVNGVTITGTPTSGQVITASSGTAAAWSTPASAGGTTVGGDLSGTVSSATVAKVNGVTVSGTPSANQVLTASSSSAATWSTPASGFADPTTTKGDLIVHGSSTTRLPVGTNGQVLTADSTQSAGVKWATASGGGSTFNPVAKTTTYTAANLDFVIGNASSAGFTVTLPAASSGAWVRVKKMDSSVNAILVVPQSGSKLDGVTPTSYSVNSQYMSQDFMSDGTDWYLI